MGWEVHMTRADHWAHSDQRPITAAEWLAVVSADPELRIDGQLELPRVGRGGGSGSRQWHAETGVAPNPRSKARGR